MTVRHCRNCRAPIRWEVTSHGKRIPLDIDPNPDGNVILREGVAIVLNPKLRAQLRQGTLYMPHHATCPGIPLPFDLTPTNSQETQE